jgi:hypothetical protein
LDTSAPGGLPDTPTDGTSGLTRSSRALIGWMPQAQGEMLLTGNTMGQEVTADQREVVQIAREAVASRPAGCDQADLLSESPPELGEHISRLRQSPAGAAMFGEGWDVAIVDLTRVCAFQPTVVADDAVERVAHVKADDISAIAEITLPTGSAEPLQPRFDPSKQTYTVVSPNRNLRIAGLFSAPAPDGSGAVILGFAVLAAPSFLQVVHFQDRTLLRDGNHRAYGFLRRGITHVPAFVRTMQTIEEVVSPGMFLLPQHSYLGDRPPMLRDYLDDQVACSVRLPAEQKLVLVQGIELSPAA